MKRDIASLIDSTGLRLPDVVKESTPADFEARNRLLHNLLGVLPDVFVPPLIVAKAHHSGDLGEPWIQTANRVQRVEAWLWVLRDQQAIEMLPQIGERNCTPLCRGGAPGRTAEQGRLARDVRRPPGCFEGLWHVYLACGVY
ncbi:MAG: hypothetical protein AAF436_05475 [Myxococcota bacterium]